MGARSTQQYRLFMKICDEWPLDPTRKTRDIALLIRQKGMFIFKQSNSTTLLNSQVCRNEQDSLRRLVDNVHHERWRPRPRTEGSSGINLEIIKKMLSDETMELSKLGDKGVLSRNFEVLKSFTKPKS
ncbi:ubiquinol-cytochrome-c reductase complex assembly factor 2-like [Pecten maximus]|uniref:ubiquinol-cytochrome-c reductase complex assembly factor 2-like n=1 Tax=Pecten maximus TaxID=6579 RepID=UPI0014589FEA|nr:ubiquinol-cytochrome-c reductase complex assembly factor 2-like [Pecten maximus]